MSSIIDNEEYEQLKRLINISRMIEDLYKRLIKLEIEGKKDSLEYYKFQNYLKMVLELEQQLYENIEMDFDKVERLCKFLIDTSKINIAVSNMESIVESNFEKRIIRRVLVNILRNNKDMDSFMKEFLNEDRNGLVNKVYKKREASNLEMTNILNSYRLLQYDTWATFKYFIRKASNDRTNIFIRNNLIEAYYNLLFINPYLENDLFNENEELILNLNEKNNLLNEDETKRLRRFVNYTSGQNVLKLLLNISDVDFSYIENMRKATILQCLFRSILLLLNEEDVKKLEGLYQKIIKDESYLKKYPDDKISKAIVGNTFSLYLNDQNLINNELIR